MSDVDNRPAAVGLCVAIFYVSATWRFCALRRYSVIPVLRSRHVIALGLCSPEAYLAVWHLLEKEVDAGKVCGQVLC